MLDRISLFLSDLVVMIVVVLICKFVLRIFDKKYGEKLNSISWLADNADDYKKFIIPSAVFLFLVYAPILEELIFRAPLVILFPEVTRDAWYAILISNAIFTVTHIKNINLVGSSGLAERYKKGTLKSDDFKQESDKLREETFEEIPKSIILAKYVQTLLVPASLGTISGYLGIKHQSLWIPVLVHSATNLLSPLINMVINLPLLVVVIVYYFAEDRIKYGLLYTWRQKRRLRKLERLHQERRKS